MICTAFTDGASRGNPGDSGIGIIVKDESGHTILVEHKYIGHATNNIAEYSALLTLLKHIQTTGCTHLLVHSDSELMVRQVNGEYKVKDQKLQEYHREVMQLIAGGSVSCEIRHIPRSENKEADRLANMAIDSQRQIQL